MTDLLTSETVSMAEPRKISNSEVSTWLVCERQYYYQFDLNLEPIRHSEALNRGLLGHEILACYYKELQRGRTHEEAMHTAREFLKSFISGNVYDLPVVLEVDNILQSYWAYRQGDPNWRILHVEEQFNVFFTQEFEFSMRLDLLVQDLTTGEVILVDHKFVYDFWTQDDLALNPQLPKYIGALRVNGFKVDRALLNQLRYRKLKEPTPERLFVRESYSPSNQKVVNIVRDQITASEEIMAWRALPLEERGKKAKHILNKVVCKNCPAKLLCQQELDGAPLDYLIQTEYKSRTYGYNEPSTAGLEALI